MRDNSSKGVDLRYAEARKQKKVETDRRISLSMSDAMYRELTLRKLDEGRSYNAIILDAIRSHLARS